jgi:hypothetical protein
MSIAKIKESEIYTYSYDFGYLSPDLDFPCQSKETNMALSGYLSPAKAIAMLALSENEHALYSCTNSTTIMLDSRATRHFSRIRSDFKNLKH